MYSLVYWLIGLLERLPQSVIGLLARCAIGLVFWNSGRTKVTGWNIFSVNDNTKFLFAEEYKVPFLNPETSALLAQVSEHVLPVLLVLGLATRISALGLLGMTAVIQIFVYPNAYVLHGTWAAILLYLMKYGPGAIFTRSLVGTTAVVNRHACEWSSRTHLANRTQAVALTAPNMGARAFASFTSSWRAWMAARTTVNAILI
jgi:putative oxidoreductase